MAGKTMRHIILAAFALFVLIVALGIGTLSGEKQPAPEPVASTAASDPQVTVIRPDDAASRVADEAAARPGRLPPLIKVQAPMSPRCSTPAGVCLVPPQPIGSPCTCGDVAGTIIP